MSGWVDLYSSDHVCGATFQSAPLQDEMARIVMDIENVNNLEESGAGSGHARKMKAHFSPAQSKTEQGGSEQRVVEEVNGLRGTIGNSSKLGVSLFEGPIMGETFFSRKSFYEGSSSGGCMPERGSSSKGSKEGKGVKLAYGARKGVHSFQWLEEGGLKGRSVSNSPSRRRKKKVLAELGEPSSHPRRSARISARLSKVDASSVYREGTPLASISDKDISNCNTRLCTSRILAESPNLWEIGKKVGLLCRGDEDEVINEYACMEVRDVEVLNIPKEGSKNDEL